jgi:hypothetical protein
MPGTIWHFSIAICSVALAWGCDADTGRTAGDDATVDVVRDGGLHDASGGSAAGEDASVDALVRDGRSDEDASAHDGSASNEQLLKPSLPRIAHAPTARSVR